MLVIVAGPTEELPDKRAKNKPHYLHMWAALKGPYSGSNKWTTDLGWADRFIAETTANNVARRKGCADYKLMDYMEAAATGKFKSVMEKLADE